MAERGRPGAHSSHPRWWQLEGAALANEVCSINDGLEVDQRKRLDRYTLNLSRYEGRKLDGFHAAAYDSPRWDFSDEVRLPLFRSLCDTVQADIAGRQRPKPEFLTNGADWATARRAKKLDRFVEGVLHQPHGRYINAWEMIADVFLDAAILGCAGVKVFVNPVTEKVELERVLPGRVKVDPREADQGRPLNYFDAYLMDEDAAIAEFADSPPDLTEKEREAIRDAITSSATKDDGITEKFYGSTRIAKSIKIREATRLPFGPDKPGHRAICIPGKVLHLEEWTREDEGIVWFRWSRERRGYWGTGLIDEAESMVKEANEAAVHLQERVKLLSNRRTYVHRLSGITEEQMQANEVENVIYYDGEGPPPVESQLPPFHPAELEYLNLYIQQSYAMPGVSQMSASSRKEQGVDAAVAMRTLVDLATKRFTIKARFAYEYPFVPLAKAIIASVAEWTDATGKDYVAQLPSKGSTHEIKWSEARIDLDSVVVQVAAVSALPSDLAGRLSFIKEMYADGVISVEEYRRMMDAPDIDAESDLEHAWVNVLDQTIEKMVDAKDAATGADEYVPPQSYIPDKAAALKRVSGRYWQETLAGAPEFVLALLRRYMLQLVELVQREMAPPPPDPNLAPPPAGPPSPVAGGNGGAPIMPPVAPPGPGMPGVA